MPRVTAADCNADLLIVSAQIGDLYIARLAHESQIAEIDSRIAALRVRRAQREALAEVLARHEQEDGHVAV